MRFGHRAREFKSRNCLLASDRRKTFEKLVERRRELADDATNPGEIDRSPVQCQQTFHIRAVAVAPRHGLVDDQILRVAAATVTPPKSMSSARLSADRSNGRYARINSSGVPSVRDAKAARDAPARTRPHRPCGG